MTLGREFIVASLALNIAVLARAIEQGIDVAHKAKSATLLRFESYYQKALPQNTTGNRVLT